MANSSLVDVIVRADPSNYTSGRGGYKINHITIHHMAGILTAAQCGNIFAKKGRNGSSNYGVGSDGKVGLYVNEGDRAWCDSNWLSNCTTVSIETSNCKTGGDWPISEKTFDKLVKLVADVAKRNGLGKLVPGKNLTWHSMYTATTCPGNWLRNHMQDLANRANGINYPPTSKDSFLPAKGYWGYGDTSSKVGEIATFMNKTFPVYSPKSVLGNYFGKNLTASVKEFQRRTKLTPIDGCVGPKTLAMLRKYGFKH